MGRPVGVIGLLGGRSSFGRVEVGRRGKGSTDIDRLEMNSHALCEVRRSGLVQALRE